MIKSQLVLRIAGQNPQLFHRDVEKMVSTVLDEIVAALAQGSRVELRGFGTFAVKVREGRVGRNPKTGATVHVLEKKIPVFRQGREIRKRLNPPATTPISPEQTSSV